MRLLRHHPTDSVSTESLYSYERLWPFSNLHSLASSIDWSVESVHIQRTRPTVIYIAMDGSDAVLLEFQCSSVYVGLSSTTFLSSSALLHDAML